MLSRPRGLAWLIAITTLTLCSIAVARDCVCPAAQLKNGWCPPCRVGYVAGVPIRAPLLFEAIDAHGHDIDPASIECPHCHEAMASDGFCRACRVGYVKQQLYFSELTYAIARGTPRPKPLDLAGNPCQACTKTIAAAAAVRAVPGRSGALPPAPVGPPAPRRRPVDHDAGEHEGELVPAPAHGHRHGGAHGHEHGHRYAPDDVPMHVTPPPPGTIAPAAANAGGPPLDPSATPARWCRACDLGMVGNVSFHDRDDYARAVAQYELLVVALSASHRCEYCAIGMFTRGECPDHPQGLPPVKDDEAAPASRPAVPVGR